MLVGRQAQLERLCGRIRDGLPVCVHGEFGVGKSALIHAAADATGRRVLAGGGLASLMWSPYLPLLRAVRVPLPAGDRTMIAAYIVHRIRDGVLVIDDLHCADRDTLAILPEIASRSSVLMAFRDGEPGSEAALAAARACSCELIELACLDDEAAAQLVRSRNSRLTEIEVRAVVSASGGNPLLALEQATGEPGQARAGDAIARRLARCSEQGREALALLGLLGRPAPQELVGDAAGELLAAGLLEQSGSLVRPRHPVFGERAVSGADRAALRRLHVRLAEALADPGERARHLAAGGRTAEAAQAALEAADRAPSPGERARHLGLAAACASGAEADALRVRAASALATAGEHGTALRLLERVEAREGSVAAAAAVARVRALTAVGRAIEALEAAAAASALVREDTALELELRLEALRVDAALRRDPSSLLAEAGELVSRCERAGLAQARAHLLLGSVQLAAGDAGWHATLTGAVERARGADDFEVECAAAQALILGHLLAGSGSSAREWARDMEGRCAARLLRGPEIQFAARRLWLDLHELGAVKGVIEECRRLLQDPLPEVLSGQLEALLALALADTGELQEARRGLERALARPGGDRGRLLSWTRAEVELLSGDVSRSLELARECLADALVAYPVGPLAAVTAAWAARDLSPEQDAGTGSPTIDGQPYGGVRRELSGIARLAGDPAAARVEFDGAASAWSAVQRRGVMRCEWASAEATRRSGDRELAVALLERAEQAMRDSGLVALRSRVRRSLREAGVREGSGRSADARGLTAREREVLELVGQGLTTAAIARRLALQPATVETHIESAREKLGAANRAQAAIMAGG